jgi:5'-3' exonuclease
MGIPVYFASLIKSHKNIVDVVKKNIPRSVDVLGVDFNCLIHRYLKDEDPIKSVLDAFQYILENVCRAKQVIIALDGLVPYAKIVQQRYRRMRVKESTGPFDRNQISPDTPYMRELEKALALRFPYAIISGTSVPGEGEHKLIDQLKMIPEVQRKSICIYGLDADLILICLKHHKLSNPHGMTLLRESAEFNDPSLKIAEFATLSIWRLLDQLPIEINQYIALSIMCFGNDFMPSLGMFSLREDGYDRALHIYHEAKKPNLLTKKGRNKFLTIAGSKEFEIFREKIKHRNRPEERSVFGRSNNLFNRKYGIHVLDGVTNMAPVVDAYWKTFIWTLDYFTNSKPTKWFWVYPCSDAPLISEILNYPESDSIDEVPLNFNITQQLQFIMPKSSLRQSKRVVKYADEIYQETRNPWMKRHDWEMKPRISLPWNPIYQLTSFSHFEV